MSDLFFEEPGLQEQPDLTVGDVSATMAVSITAARLHIPWRAWNRARAAAT